MRVAVVLGAGGFIGHHMVSRLKAEGFWVRGADLKLPQFEDSSADEFLLGDLTFADQVEKVFSGLPGEVDHVYQFAADMGGAGYIFTGENDAAVMHNSAMINLLVVDTLSRIQSHQSKVLKVFYSSSACIYPEQIQMNPDVVDLREANAYPAQPDSEYGWEKLFSERLFGAYSRNRGLSVRVARFHNVYGPFGTWRGGKEKAPAAICRKVLEAGPGGQVEVWGDGTQTRSFLFISDCIEAVWRFMNQDVEQGPINIGSEEMVTINYLVELAAKSAGYHVAIRHIRGPLGVKGRNSNNELMRRTLDWDYEVSLDQGVSITLDWIKSQMEKHS